VRCTCPTEQLVEAVAANNLSYTYEILVEKSPVALALRQDRYSQDCHIDPPAKYSVSSISFSQASTKTYPNTLHPPARFASRRVQQQRQEKLMIKNK
jgi:hypothetical protein